MRSETLPADDPAAEDSKTPTLVVAEGGPRDHPERYEGRTVKEVYDQLPLFRLKAHSFTWSGMTFERWRELYRLIGEDQAGLAPAVGEEAPGPAQ